ncbi:hypothetical protein IV203_034968 [Nitzschia inconspicua]|uniref:Uncharacterized protein n=1 Tax=Nitzschia inconspicua TaxID=303405 RepID=A0A9K3LCF7_9STRA|nr:hypothetical protein IV203_034968 [Nitzschia inconspicua]
MEQCHNKNTIGKAGFLEDINEKSNPITKVVTRTTPTKASLGQNSKCLSSTVFISKRTMTMILRAIEDPPHVIAKGTLHTWPLTAYPFITTRPGIKKENENLIRQLHSKCVSVCMEADKILSCQKALNGRTKNYLPYKKAQDLIVTDPCTPADHVLTNNRVETIISAMWEGPDTQILHLDSQMILSYLLPMNPMATSPPMTLLQSATTPT